MDAAPSIEYPSILFFKFSIVLFISYLFTHLLLLLLLLQKNYKVFKK